MCGITGFVDFSHKLNESFLKDCVNKLEHRGPDDSGTYFQRLSSASVGLGNRRLAIIDLSEKGHQPFQSVCGNYILVFNGIIYNYKELRSQLIDLGARFTSQSDTEVLLQAYIFWPNSFLDKINGIYALGLFDRINNKFLLIRDKIGVKPLFYYFDGNTLLFGSELRIFLKQSFIPVKLDAKGLNLYLQYAYFPAPYTILENVYKVKPAEIIELDISPKKIGRSLYWNLSSERKPYENISEISDVLYSKLADSVKSRLVTEVPFGILLSGGYDSSTVAAIAQKFQTEKVKTFCIGFDEAEFNEAKEAEEIAAYLGTEHHTLYFDKATITDIITNLGKTFDEPMGDSGAVPLLMAAKLAKPYVKVLLSAEGGDELFGGYPTYFKALKLSKLNRFSIGIHKKSSNRYINILTQKDCLETYKAIIHYFTEKQAEKLTGNFIEPIGTASGTGKLNNLLSFDFQNYLPEDLLMKADRCMMHFGIENRDPLLNIDLVEYIGSLPGNLICPKNQPKYLLKQIAHQLIPEHLLDRPKKGFSIPVGKWLSENLRSFTIEKIKVFSERGLLDRPMIEDLLKKFLHKPQKYYSRQIWILLALELWMEEWFD